MSYSVLFIDPGTEQSGWIVWNGKKITDHDITENFVMVRLIKDFIDFNKSSVGLGKLHLGIEMIASYGMAVGQTTFETCVWIGRFANAWESVHGNKSVNFLFRKTDICKHVCHNSNAKDPHIRQALIDLIGPPGKKKEPGPTFGIKSHEWAALAGAVTLYDRLQE